MSGFVAVFIGTKNTLFLSFLIGGIFGIALIFIEPEDHFSIIVCLLLTKFGVSSSLNLCYLVTSEYFPVIYSSTVFGACSIFSRVISIFSPLIAEASPPFPMIIYGTFCLFSLIGTTFLNKNRKAELAIDEALIAATPLNRKNDD
jgi:hypothetical protein